MTFIDRTLSRFGLVRKSAPSWEAGIREALAFGAQTASAIAVSPESAMRCPAALAAATIRCQTLASLSCKVFKRDGDEKRAAPEHSLYPLVNRRSSEQASASELFAALEFDVLVHGQAFGFANRLGDGRVYEITRLKPSSVTVESDDFSGALTYKIALKNGGQREVPAQDILHVRSLGDMSVIKNGREAIGLSIALERHFAHILSRGGRPSGTLSSAKALTPEAFERFRKQFDNAYGGDAAGKTLLLEDGMAFAPIEFKSVDMQTHESRLFQVLEVARVFQVPPNMIFDYSRGTFMNAAEMSENFRAYTLLPRVKYWEAALNRLLLPEERDGFFVEFNLDALARSDIETRFAAYSSAIASRFMSPNEVRERENLPPGPAELDRFENPNVMSTPAPRPRNRPTEE